MHSSRYPQDLGADARSRKLRAEVFSQDFVRSEVLGRRATKGVERLGAVLGDGGCVVEITIVWDLGDDCVGAGGEEVGVDFEAEF